MLISFFCISLTFSTGCYWAYYDWMLASVIKTAPLLRSGDSGLFAISFVYKASFFFSISFYNLPIASFSNLFYLLLSMTCYCKKFFSCSKPSALLFHFLILLAWSSFSLSICTCSSLIWEIVFSRLLIFSSLLVLLLFSFFKSLIIYLSSFSFLLT